MIIWLASYPRSGNTYFRILLKHYYGLTTYSVYDDPLLFKLGLEDSVGHEKLPKPWRELLDVPEVYFVKTHREPSHPGKTVYIIRDGRDATVSMAHYGISFGKKRWKYRFFPFLKESAYRDRLITLSDPQSTDTWAGHVRSWLAPENLSPERPTVILKYEDLLVRPEEEMERVLSELGVKLEKICSEPPPTFQKLNQANSKFFRRGIAGSWKTESTPEFQKAFLASAGDLLRRFGYEMES